MAVNSEEEMGMKSFWKWRGFLRLIWSLVGRVDDIAREKGTSLLKTICCDMGEVPCFIY